MNDHTIRTTPSPWLFAVLYFAEGAPIGLLWWALPSVLRTSGVDVSAIATLVALLGIPWALKFLWAPLVDLGRSNRWGYRDWIVASQIAMGLFLLPVALGWAELGFIVLSLCLMLHAVAAATQDVAIDGLCITAASRMERGRLNGWMQAGMLLGRSLFGGATLVLLDVLSFGGAALVLIAVLWTSAVGVRWFVPREVAPISSEARRPLLQGAIAAWKQVVASPASRWGLLFAATSGASFEAVGTLAGPFLVDAGVETSTIGWFLGVVSVAMMGIGALVGGRLADAWPRRRAVAAAFGAVGVSVTFLSVSAIAEWGLVIAAPMAMVYGSIGLFTSSSYAWLMDLSQNRFSATQFSAFMGATNLCEVWSTASGGHLQSFAEGRGGLSPGPSYGATFLALLLVSLVSLVFLRRGVKDPPSIDMT